MALSAGSPQQKRPADTRQQTNTRQRTGIRQHMDKAELRKQMKQAEKAFLASGKQDIETAEIWHRVEESEQFRDAGTVMIYMDIPGEVPTGDFIRKWHNTKRIVIPRVNGEMLNLCEYDPQKIQEGYKGILEPAADVTIVNPEEIELALVPGVAFTHSGARLGRGKGFYDKLLPLLKCPCVGIGFSFRWVDEIPTDPWDAPLSII